MSNDTQQGASGEKKLGILVRKDQYLDQVINLVEAAYKKGLETQLFFTGKSVMLTQDPDFAKLVGKANRISVCDVSFRANELSGEVPGVSFRDFATQARNAEMVGECDRYVVF
ncbi:hypothetical protein Dthio_PD1186 [Desulfonatronospira thiodismutans ASO3-1]|uniref:DsrE family protein n=1 Tax=Desulfonatronospira thiodismutans ASO3-1 TaxID=555779 RepID=D6ST31_9BACT|nr:MULTISPECIES: hypothetical protein [Desulfonatronospira]EFI33847.1 hypothetical protein Dthio_PD1186 [Desulfonatronospira thiodismutans ASO3-1]RQD78612.1 MAG: hypothetical protein D5S03_02115 [Desulfonatronospira sp. MSAO_Bac3]